MKRSSQCHRLTDSLWRKEGDGESGMEGGCDSMREEGIV